MKTEIETCAYVSVSLSEEDKTALKKSKDIIDNVCTVMGNYGTTIAFDDDYDSILLSNVMEALEELDYFIDKVDGKQVEIIPY